MTNPPITEDMKQRSLHVANAEIAEALRDLCFAANLPPTEVRVQKIAGCIQGIERAVNRLETAVLGQSTTHRSRLLAAVLTAELQFLDYEKQHRAKGTPEADVKADANKRMAATMANARENRA